MTPACHTCAGGWHPRHPGRGSGRGGPRPCPLRSGLGGQVSAVRSRRSGLCCQVSAVSRLSWPAHAGRTRVEGRAGIPARPPGPESRETMQTAAAESALAAGSLDEQLSARLLQQRIIVLGAEVDDRIANRLCTQLLLLSAEDPRSDISLYINSPGGSVSAGLAIYDTMRLIPNDVSTLAMGLAASMGQFLLCAGTPGKRFSLPRPGPHAPGLGRLRGHRGRHRDLRRAAGADRNHDGQADRAAHRAAGGAGRAGQPTGSLVQRGGSAGVRVHRLHRGERRRRAPGGREPAGGAGA